MSLSADLKSAKKVLRERVIAQRDALDADRRRDCSAAITRRLLVLPDYRAADIVAAYASFGSEFDTTAFLEDVLATGKQLLLPRINKDERRLELRQVEKPGTDLVAGVWGIREPGLHCPLRSITAAVFILVPGVAFTAKGDRLGYGGGFYDRLLAEAGARARRISAAFSLQVVGNLPTGECDQRVHCIVTESKTLLSGQPYTS